MLSVQNQWAFITGSARGLGALTAKLLAQQGCNLILHGREISHCDEILREVRSFGVKAYVVGAELSDPDAIREMLDEIDRKMPSVGIVFNNAGMQTGYLKHYFETPVSDFTISFQINTIAPALICYHFLPKMMQAGFGRIINITSGIALEPEQAGYSASKAALDKITIDLASKIDGTDVMLNLVDPGWCRTDMGGIHAPNAPESAIPGIAVPAFLNDQRSGRLFRAQEFSGMSLTDAVAKAERI
ncbi:MAG: SDR family oxidoreductase [Oscillospiraceae bacterium]|nr:SDR family oxidoreductase [Oscillospiraceae bacterium]